MLLTVSLQSPFYFGPIKLPQLTSYFLFLSFSVHASLGFCVLVRYCQEFCGHSVFPLLHETLNFAYESLSKLQSVEVLS